MTHLSQDKMSEPELLKRAQICFDNGEFEEAIKSWEELLKFNYDKAVLLRMAAVAWHQCKDEVMALEYLSRLSLEDKGSRKCRWFIGTLQSELCVLVEKYGRLAMKEAAFSLYFVLRSNSLFSFSSEGVLDDLYSRELSSPSIHLLRQKLRVLREKVFRLDERDSAFGKILKSAKGHLDNVSNDDVDDEKEEFIDKNDEDMEDSESDEWYEDDDYENDDYENDDSSDSPDLLPRLEKEVQLLQLIEKTVLDKELKWVASSGVSEYMELFSNRKIIEELEKLLAEVEPVLDKFADYSGKSVLEVKDFIGSFLPGVIRDKVCNDEYLDVVRMENDLERKLLLFVRYCYK